MSFLLSKPQTQPNGLIQDITPQNANWEYVGFAAYQLDNQSITLESGEDELCLVFVAGKGSVFVDEHRFENIGNRASPFEKIPDRKSVV